MKLSELVEHTGSWLGASTVVVGTFARFLREGGMISVGGRGGGAAEMNRKDSAIVFVAYCGMGTARQAATELPKWIERCPGLIEHIEACIKNPPTDTSIEFDVDGYCARFVRKDGRTKTFGNRKLENRYRGHSFLVRHVPAASFSGWLDGLRD